MKANKLIEKFEANVETLDRRLHEAKASAGVVVAEKRRVQEELDDGFERLAEHCLVRGNVSASVSRILELREQEREFLNTQLKPIDDAVEANNQEIALALESLRNEEVRIRQEQLNDPEYSDLATRVSNAETKKLEAQAHHGQLMAEIQSKMAVYQASTLYQYCKTRKEKFNAVDKLVAKLCNFDNNRSNELILREMQAVLKDSSEAIDAELDTARQIQATLLEKAMLSPVRKKLSQQIAELKSEVKKLESEDSRLRHERELFEQNEDKRYREAFQATLKELTRSSANQLIERVQRTPGKEDDKLVTRLLGLANQHTGIGVQIGQTEREVRLAKDDLEKAKTLHRAVDNSKFNSSRFEYDSSLDVSSLVTGFMAGTIALTAVTSALASARREIAETRHTPSYGGNSSSSSSDSWGSSSSSSSDSWGSSSSSSGSDYSTSSSSGGGDYETKDSF